MDSSLITSIESSKSALLLLPDNPSFDEVAACLALNAALENAGIATTVASATQMLVEFNRLVGVDKVTQNIANKNLTIKFPDYDINNIEKVNYEIIENNKIFSLNVFCKPGAQPPTQQQAEFVYFGVSADIIILFGGKSGVDFPALKINELSELKKVHLGKRGLETDGMKIEDFAKPSATLSEQVANLVKDSQKLEMTSDIATNLIMGIEEETANFASPDVTADTFATTAELLRAGGQRTQTQKIDRNDFPVGSIPGEVPQTPAPKAWFEEPKIYKGTTVS